MTSEASSLAGVQQLGNLVVIYDQNHISIEDDTAIALQRGHRQAVRGVRLARADRRLDRWRGPEGGQGREVPRGRPGPATTRSSRPARRRPARRCHRAEDRPRLAGAQRPEHRQGARVGARRGRGRARPSRCSASTRTSTSRSTTRRSRAPARSSTAGGSGTPSGTSASPSGRPTTPTGSSSGTGCASGGSRRAGRTSCPTFEAGKAVATRKASSGVLNALKDVLPELWGGSADLAESNNTAMEGEPSFLPADDRDEAVGPGRPLRAHPALRHPRARHGLDHERHRAARRHARLRRHLPGVQRLHASRRPARRHPEAAGDLRLDPRLHRPRRGRPDPPAGRAPGRAAGDPRTSTSSAPATPTRPPGPGARSSSTPTGPPGSASAGRTCPRSTARRAAASRRPTASPAAPTSCRRRTAARRA